MQIITKAQAKTVVSALRREIKALGKGPEELSHTDCLTLTAKALGFASWNAWEASLLEAAAEKPAPVESKYPLVNNGDFDFISPDEAGKAFSGDFVPLASTADVVEATAGFTVVTRASSDGSLTPDFDGGSDVDWDSQETRLNAQGHGIWLCEDGEEFSEGQVVIAPEECYEPYEDEELPVRPKLIQAFLDYFAEERIDAAALKGKFGKIAEVIGFELTMKEEEELRAKVEGSLARA